MKEYTSKEIKVLKANPYTFKVTKSKLYFTAEFKEAFWIGYQAGITPRKLLLDMGYDTEMFGQKQIDSIVQRIKKQAQNGYGFTQGENRNQRGYSKGARSIYMCMLHWDKPVIMNLKKIRRMNKYGPVCPIRKANPYRRMAKAIKTNHIAENILNRKFTEYGVRKVLLTDITYIPYDGKHCYLSTILDAYTKQILSYKLSDSLEVDFVLETVK